MQLDYKVKRGTTDKDKLNANIDNLIFGIFCSFIQMKWESLFSEMESIFKEKQLFDTICLASKITTQRSYKSLINEAKKLLPEYFGFESVGVLLLDTKTMDLFTIAEIQKDMSDVKEGDEYAESGDTISFPSTLGITGQVYQTKEVYICNHALNDRKFMADIDNLSSIIEVENFMIGPIFNTSTPQPIGIIQLINKKGKRNIEDQDIKKFKIIQELLGRSVYNTSEIHKLINVTIGMSSMLGNINNLAMNSVFEYDILTKNKKNNY